MGGESANALSPNPQMCQMKVHATAGGCLRLYCVRSVLPALKLLLKDCGLALAVATRVQVPSGLLLKGLGLAPAVQPGHKSCLLGKAHNSHSMTGWKAKAVVMVLLHCRYARHLLHTEGCARHQALYIHRVKAPHISCH